MLILSMFVYSKLSAIINHISALLLIIQKLVFDEE